MAIHFDADRMEQVVHAHELWWKGKLDRPLARVTLTDAHPAPPSKAPILSQSCCLDFSWSPEQLIDALDADLSRQEFLGDAFPWVNFDAFGPGVLAAFCGARIDNSTGAIWFFPDKEREIEDIHVRYNPENEIVKRIKAIYRAGLEKWNGSVIMGLPDLGGVMDVAASFRGSENLLMDLYDAPEEVLRLNREIHAAWYEAYEDFSAVLSPQKYNTNWCGLLSRDPSYIIQCDFSYMIGNPMFRQFVLEDLRADTRRLTNTIYHLDGVGELNHLDDLLSLEDLNAVQWVFGDGQLPAECWMDVYRRIIAAGKQYMITGTPESTLKVVSELHGSLYFKHFLPASQAELAEKLIRAR